MTNEQAMARAIELALRGTGHVSPNPRVGCVLLKDGRIIGEGWHRKFGEPHAEREAITNATEDVVGATAVVTLEPCSHVGKQPPCADLLIERNISRVIIGMQDANPLVSGNGIERLRAAGIGVTVGVLGAECAWLDRTHTKTITTKMPYIIAKTGQTLDGCIASHSHESQWITSQASRQKVHALRAEFDAVMIGKTTALVDNPALTVRHVEGRQPWRIVLDTRLELPPTLQLFTDEFTTKTIVICGHTAATSPNARLLRESGIQVLGCDTDSHKHLILRNAFRDILQDYGIASIMVEGGSLLLSALLQENLIDEYHFFIAPMLLGGGKQVFGNFLPTLALAPKLRVVSSEKCGEDWYVVAVAG